MLQHVERDGVDPPLSKCLENLSLVDPGRARLLETCGFRPDNVADTGDAAQDERHAWFQNSFPVTLGHVLQNERGNLLRCSSSTDCRSSTGWLDGDDNSRQTNISRIRQAEVGEVVLGSRPIVQSLGPAIFIRPSSNFTGRYAPRGTVRSFKAYWLGSPLKSSSFEGGSF